jgi:ABC-type transport system substrate-binding protein
VLEQNRFYRGERPHHVARFVGDLTIDEGVAIDEVEQGKFDTALPYQLVNPRSAEFEKRYRVNRTRFFVVPGAGLRVLVLNTSRPLFRNNVQLRQAVNFAVDRKAIAREDGYLAATPTDQYLLPGSPGYVKARVYPLAGPDLRRARALAKGRTRGGKAVLYTLDLPGDSAQAQILQRNLKRIGIEVEIKRYPPPPGILFGKLATPGEPWEFGRIVYGANPDPALLDCFNGRTIGECNFTNFNSPKYNKLLDRASQLTGEARYRAYGTLDVKISRDAAPAIPVSIQNALSFVSARVGCVVVNPYLDLAAVCLN